MKISPLFLTVLFLCPGLARADWAEVNTFVTQGKYTQAYAELIKLGDKGQAIAYTKAADLVMSDVVDGIKPEKGPRLLRMAAEKGDPNAYMNLAFLYKTGTMGLPEDVTEESKLLKLAFDNGVRDAGSALGWLMLTSKDPRVSNSKVGYETLIKSAKAGSGYAYIRLGEAYWLGVEGLERNQIVGYALYKEGQARGIKGSEPKIEEKLKSFNKDPDALKKASALRETLKSTPVDIALSSYFSKNPRSYDYRKPSTVGLNNLGSGVGTKAGINSPTLAN